MMNNQPKAKLQRQPIHPGMVLLVKLTGKVTGKYAHEEVKTAKKTATTRRPWLLKIYS
jgi:hypothetical protein